MKKIMVVFGTRPEAIKLAPVIRELRSHSNIGTVVCVTAQHREMLDQVLDLFRIAPDYDLNIMTEGQDLFDITIKVLAGLAPVLRKERPDIVLVQGDTTTAFAASLAAFYLQISIGHIEAGLRTGDKYRPFPEEKNRQLTGILADYHFAPTAWAKANLLREKIPEQRIWVTGNTVVDALLSMIERQKAENESAYWNAYFCREFNLNLREDRRKLIMVTGHRRESFGEGLRNMCCALREIAENHPEVLVVYPVHPNPNVQKTVNDILGCMPAQMGTSSKRDSSNIRLIQPLDYAPFVYLMSKAYLVITDSGGIQEEAPSLGIPVLVTRETTERPEGVEAGTSKLVGTKRERIVAEVEDLLLNRDTTRIRLGNPYGDGNAAKRIAAVLAEYD